MPFLSGIRPKVNVTARLEFELAYYDMTVQRVTLYAKETFSLISVKDKFLELP